MFINVNWNALDDLLHEVSLDTGILPSDPRYGALEHLVAVAVDTGVTAARVALREFVAPPAEL
jgi:hypothetical protein